MRMWHDRDPESIGEGQGHFTITNMPTIEEWPLRGHQFFLVSSWSDKKQLVDMFYFVFQFC